MEYARTVTFLPPKSHPTMQIAKHESTPVWVPIAELLSDTFIERHTRFTSIEAFINASGLDPRGLAILDMHSQRLWDAFVRATSTFSNWNGMIQAAQGEWILRRMGISVDA